MQTQSDGQSQGRAVDTLHNQDNKNYRSFQGACSGARQRTPHLIPPLTTHNFPRTIATDVEKLHTQPKNPPRVPQSGWGG